MSDDEVDTGDEECHSCGSYGHSTNQCDDGIEELREQHREMLELLREWARETSAPCTMTPPCTNCRTHALLKRIDGET